MTAAPILTVTYGGELLYFWIVLVQIVQITVTTSLLHDNINAHVI